MFGSNRYNYEQFERSTLLKDLAKSKFGSAPEPGDRAPDFEGRTLDGDKIRLSDYKGAKNVVLTFGSATCPLTAGSIRGIDDICEDYRDDGVECLFVYSREAHPGDEMPAHKSMNDKIAAAERFRDEEKVTIPIIVDDLSGKIHRKYGKLPNPTFIIDKSGRISFRALSTRPSVIADALDELLERQEERGDDHVIVRGGEDAWMASPFALLHAYRALERGGKNAIDDFKREMGTPGKVVVIGSRVAGPIADNIGITVASIAAVGGVVALGLWVGSALRKRRFRNPYEYRNVGPERGDFGDYEAVGI